MKVAQIQLFLRRALPGRVINSVKHVMARAVLQFAIYSLVVLLNNENNSGGVIN